MSIKKLIPFVLLVATTFPLQATTELTGKDYLEAVISTVCSNYGGRLTEEEVKETAILDKLKKDKTITNELIENTRKCKKDPTFVHAIVKMGYLDLLCYLMEERKVNIGKIDKDSEDRGYFL